MVIYLKRLSILQRRNPEGVRALRMSYLAIVNHPPVVVDRSELRFTHIAP